MRTSALALALLSILAVPTSVRAEVIGGVEFPEGTVSFADLIVSYSPSSPGPIDPLRGADNALGAPDYTGSGCVDQASCTFVTLGDGGSLVAEFVDNVLTGSGTSALDLWIFEIGPDVEDMFVDVSTDGVNWISIGSVGGATAGIDLDSFGYGTDSAFSFVRLTDDTDKDEQVGNSAGADIDAIGAITTRVVSGVPEPSTWAMLLFGFGLVGWRMRSRRPVHSLVA